MAPRGAAGDRRQWNRNDTLPGMCDEGRNRRSPGDGLKRPTHVEQGQTGSMTVLQETRVDLLAESCLEQKEGYGRHASNITGGGRPPPSAMEHGPSSRGRQRIPPGRVLTSPSGAGGQARRRASAGPRWAAQVRFARCPTERSPGARLAEDVWPGFELLIRTGCRPT